MSKRQVPSVSMAESEAETRSGRVMFRIRVECDCGWATVGQNTTSLAHLRDWARGMAEWHLSALPRFDGHGLAGALGEALD